MYVHVFTHSRKENLQTIAVLSFLSASVRSEPFLSNHSNILLSFLIAAKYVPIGRSVLPRANMASVSTKIASVPGTVEVRKCYNRVQHISQHNIYTYRH